VFLAILTQPFVSDSLLLKCYFAAKTLYGFVVSRAIVFTEEVFTFDNPMEIYHNEVAYELPIVIDGLVDNKLSINVDIFEKLNKILIGQILMFALNSSHT